MDEATVRSSAFARLRGRALAWLSKPANLILLFFLIALIVLTLYPLYSLLMETVTIHAGREARAAKEAAGSLSFYHFRRLFATKENEYSWIQFYEPFLNTLTVSLAASLIAIVFGGTVAFMVTRTNLKYIKFISAVFTFPYIMPSWTLALFWENFFKNVNIGLKTSNGIMAGLFGIYMPEWFVYGAFPIALVLGLHYAPYAYILIGAMLRNMDANLEEAATILRTNRFRIIWCITLPIVKPAMMSTFLLVFASSMSAYSVPVFLGSPVRYYMLSTKMKSLMDSYPGQAYIIAAVMILMGIIILLLNQRVTNSRKHFTTVTGKSSRISKINLGRANTPIAIVLVIVLLLVAVLPLLTFALESVIIKAGDYRLSNMTLDFWIGTDLIERLDQGDSTGILLNPKVWKALGYSLSLSAACAFVAGTCGILTGYSVVKRRGSKLANLVNSLAFFPYLMPSLALGAIYLAMSAKIPWLRGFLLLALAGSVKYLPFASRSGVNAMLQLSNEIEEAAIITGVPWWKRMLKIIVPIQKPGFLSGYLVPLVSCMRELSLFVLLVPTSNTILTTMLMQYSEKGWAQFGNAINLLIILVVLLVNFIVNKLTGASIDKGVGG
ncbi:MAG: iron ABC transporter permease [Clostridia bacterium]|nr:iron ABC transporter permease [Oscillospiraceae bacterium]MBQ4437228.1 iron ABC transporter permease [Clostridia bacterium]